MNITIRGALLDLNNAETDSFTQPSHQQLNSLASCARLWRASGPPPGARLFFCGDCCEIHINDSLLSVVLHD